MITTSRLLHRRFLHSSLISNKAIKNPLSKKSTVLEDKLIDFMKRHYLIYKEEVGITRGEKNDKLLQKTLDKYGNNYRRISMLKRGNKIKYLIDENTNFSPNNNPNKIDIKTNLTFYKPGIPFS